MRPPDGEGKAAIPCWLLFPGALPDFRNEVSLIQE